jgi:hypothetical protein
VSIRNWKHYKVPGQKLDVFTRSNPAGEEIKDTYVEGVSPRRKKKKRTVRISMRDAADALRDARRL